MRSSSRRRRAIATAVLVPTLVALLAACASGAPGGATTSAAPVSDGATQIGITLTGTGSNDVCTIDHATAKAGPVTFTVTDASATAITEVELLSGQQIIGEKENLAPGLGAVSFTVTLTGGTYRVYCPGAATEMQTITVTGKSAAKSGSSTETLLTEGTKTYGTYVAGVVADMVSAVGSLQTAVDSGDLTDAKAKYALARPFYEKIESDVDGFVKPGFTATDNAGNLDYLIDMRASNLDPKVGWHGFHAIERDLYQRDHITASTKSLAAELTSNVKELATLSKGLTYQPEDLANGAASLLEEVQSAKIKGEEEAFSHLDLLDFAANVEGAQQAFANLEPGLSKIDPTLTKQVSDQFATVNAALDTYRDASNPGGFEFYTAAIRTADASKLSAVVQGLQVPLSKIAQKVATA